MLAGACDARSAGLSDSSIRGGLFRRSLHESKNTAKSQTSISVVVEEGSASAAAKSSSQGFALEETGIVNRVIEAVSRAKAGGNVTAESELAASAIGDAVATAITESEVFVNVTGDGSAKAESSGGAQAIAFTTAKSILLGVTEASNDDGLAVSLVNMTALSEEIAKAVVDVSLSVNSTGGPKKDFKRRVAIAAAKPIAEIITDVLVAINNGTAQIRNEFEVQSHKGDVPVAETSIRDDPAIVVFKIEDPEEVGQKIEAAVTEAIGDALNKTRQDGESNSTESGKAFAFAFAFAGVGVTVSGEGYASSSGFGKAQEIANITAKAIALALAGVANNDTGSVAEVKVTVMGDSANHTSAQQETEAEASVEPVAQVVANVVSAVENGVARSRTSAGGSGSSESPPQSSPTDREEKDHRAASSDAIIAENYDDENRNDAPQEEAPTDIGSDPEKLPTEGSNQKSENEGANQKSESEDSNGNAVPSLEQEESTRIDDSTQDIVPSVEQEEANVEESVGTPGIVVIAGPTIAEGFSGNRSVNQDFAPNLGIGDQDRIPSSGSPDAEGEAAIQTEAENTAAAKSSAVGEQIDIGAEPADASIRGEVENVSDGWEQEAVMRTSPTEQSDSSAPPRIGGTGVEEAGEQLAVSPPTTGEEAASIGCDSQNSTESTTGNENRERHGSDEKASSPTGGVAQPNTGGASLSGGENDKRMSSEGSKNCCYYAVRSSPFPVCGQHCDPRVCNRGYAVYSSMDACCKKGGAFRNGCRPPPEKCYVVEKHGHVCREDQTKCLQGSNMWGSMEECCRPGNGFGKGCKKLDGTEEKCWIPGIFHPVKECIETNGNVCKRGWGVWKSKEKCCEKGNAFGGGCGKPLPTPCWVRGVHRPVRLCRKEESKAACYRGWGTYATEQKCCSKNAAFKDGCSES
ncbi:hypothetical protein BSKO_12685 [Bryopsis sp. KO-2023]|nr:hypothetical protein BSKO_12685 [Bryopsis sp. KO-2023]